MKRAPALHLGVSVLALSMACDENSKAREGARDGDGSLVSQDAGAGADAGSLDEPAARGEDFLFYTSRAGANGDAISLSFEVPKDAHSFVLTVVSQSPRTLLLTTLEGPNGRTLYSTRNGQSFPLSPPSTRNLSPQFPLSVLIPSKDLQVSGGHVSARFYAGALRGPEQGEGVDVDIVFQQNAHANTLSTRVWVPYRTEVGAGSARDSEALREGFAVMREIFLSAGISVSDPVFSDLMPPTLPGTNGVDATAIDSWLKQLPANERHGLDFLFLDELTSPEGVTLIGKTIGIPGPPSHPALARRGAVVLSRAALPTDAGRLGEILAHEAAHFLGLGHTTEMDGTHDALADTPQCPLENASFLTANGKTVPSAEDCGDFDGPNLMFWMPARSSALQRVLSPLQADLLHDHPAVR